MAKTKTVRRAKVVLKGAKSYKLAGRKFKQNVPEIVKGSDVDEFMNNAFFKCRELDSVETTIKKKKVLPVGDSDSSSKKKKKKKKASSKKTSKSKTKK